MTEGVSELNELSDRSRTILRQIVETYLTTGEPVGSRNLSRVLPMTLSPASIRNVMSDLEQLGLIAAPHTSAGRLPTQLGLRLFVDGLLQIGNLTSEERRKIEAQIASKRQQSIDDVLSEASEMISGLSHCAGVVLAEQQVACLKHIEFVPLEPGKALVVLVGEDQVVENRIIALPQGLPPSALVEAANVAVRRDSYFAKLYQRHKQSKGHGKAIMAVAHRMARILWKMLKDKRMKAEKKEVTLVMESIDYLVTPLEQEMLKITNMTRVSLDKIDIGAWNLISLRLPALASANKSV